MFGHDPTGNARPCRLHRLLQKAKLTTSDMALIKDCKSQDKEIMMMMDKGCLTLNSTHPETMLLAK